MEHQERNSEDVRETAERQHPTPKVLRRKLQVGAADDPAERDADRLANVALANLRSQHPQPAVRRAPLEVSRIRPVGGRSTSALTPHVDASPTRINRMSAGTISAAPDHADRIRRRSEPTVGAAGGDVDSATIQAIDQAHGTALAPRIRRRMEHGFGDADFSQVRVHQDASAQDASRRLSARAFTTGNDVFFNRGEYRPASDAGQRLLAHELGHVVQQGSSHTARRLMIRRAVNYGQDPKALIGDNDKDLLYGVNGPRGKTKSGLSAEQKTTIRTIDDYNRAIGINAIVTGANAAMGLYDVRAQLASVAAWGLTMDAALNTPTNQAAVQSWIDYLRQHAAHIGLEDLGDKGGFLRKAKIERGGRFKKNRAESQASQPKADQLTPDDTRKFLSSANTKVDAQTAYDAMSAPKQTALNKWIYRAFFRRTSKLGQDFTIHILDAKVHFNTVADPDYVPMQNVNWQDGGLEQMEKTGKNDKNRAITISELRHMKKLAKANPTKVNMYGEF